ncbi:hypothetical protein [Mesorhizobium sp. YR577]|uniref:hypothetical protein n=1 Tax=Mesorhizobium sp. YR577 TaxID=1884373 RepID=UPI0008DED244|nr:hypothetical protein [Mesorhizobium sp. YR577]SFU22865.1 hypothetical protein SAMN05518861_1423 [Mesorhizobium sp. YR577]
MILANEGNVSSAGRIKFRLIGPFTVSRADGLDVTPRGKRSKALLVLLALSPNGARSRKWLQSMLWSTRGEDQGAASLRQELSELRKLFREVDRDLLTSDRDTVRLHLDLIELDIGNDDAHSRAQDLLEGIDIRDPEFEEWLREQRSRLSAASRKSEANHVQAFQLLVQQKQLISVPKRICLGLIVEGSADSVCVQSVANMALNLVARSLLDFEIVDLIDYRAGLRPAEDSGIRLVDWFLQAEAMVFGEQVGLTFSLIAPGERRVAWSQSVFFEQADLGNAGSPRLMAFVNQATFGILDVALDPRTARNQPRNHASRLAFAAIHQIFCLHDADLDAAERMLAEAFEIEPRSTYLGWLLFVQVTRLGERRVARSGAFHEQVRECARQALEMGPFNPITLSLAAHAHSFVFHEYRYALELADRAIAANPLQALCWDMRALTLGYLGEVQQGYADALRARTLGGPPGYRYFIDTTCCILATLSGRFKEGVQFGELVLARQPGFLPALRYSAACHGHLGQQGDAVRIVDRLREWEPDFSLELLREVDYPIAGVLGVSVIQSGLSRIVLPRYAN